LSPLYGVEPLDAWTFAVMPPVLFWGELKAFIEEYRFATDASPPA
jgi:hypothetical protein